MGQTRRQILCSWNFPCLRTIRPVCSSGTLPVQLGPVHNGAEQTTYVDKIECIVGPRPWQVRIVDLKLYAGGDPGGLDGREVGANHTGAGELADKVTEK
jgi:hypothetical protein